MAASAALQFVNLPHRPRIVLLPGAHQVVEYFSGSGEPQSAGNALEQGRVNILLRLQ
jgi:hypothetical protein